MKFLAISEVSKIGLKKVDEEICWITRYDELHNLVDDAEFEDHGDTALYLFIYLISFTVRQP
jgi:hypothetical protein